MTVKLLSDDELLNLDADAPGYDVLDRLVGVHQWAAKARVELQSLVDVIAGKPGPDGPFVAAARAEKILAELTPPTPEGSR